MSKLESATYEKEGVKLHIDNKGVSVTARSFRFSSQPNSSAPAQCITMSNGEITLHSKTGETHE